MATLTTSWTTYSSSSFSTGVATVTFYLQARYTSQSTANNTTNVQTRLRYSITKGNDISGAGYKFTCTYASTVSGSGMYTFSGTNKDITSGSKTVTHKTDGTQTISLSATAYNKAWGFNKSMSASVSLPKINRIAKIISATNLTDEDPATFIEFTNPAKFKIEVVLSFYDKNNNYLHGFATTPLTAPYDYYTVAIPMWDSLTYILQTLNTQESYKVAITVNTLNGSTVIGSSTVNRTFTIIAGAPTLNATYQDTNPTTIAITGDNQKIIRNQSTLQFDITNAEAKKEATLSSLTADINGNVYTGTISGTTGTINVGTLDLSKNEQIPVILTDSRGFTTTAPLIVQVLDWETPTANITLERQNNFYSETDITVDANYSSLDGLNTIDIKVRTKKTTDQNYGAYTNLSDNVTTTLTLDNLYDWDVQVLVTDRLGSTTYNLNLSKGMPIIYFDRLKQSVGINCFPNGTETLEIHNQDVEKLFPVTLYDDSNGTITSITTLNDDVSNYSYLEIYIGWNGGGFGTHSTKFDLSLGTDVNLTTFALNNNAVYIASSQWTASGTSLTLTKGEYWRWLTSGSPTRNQTNNVAIFKILGYK